MSVVLQLSDHQAKDLAEMLNLAAIVAGTNQNEEAEAKLTDWGMLINQILQQLSQTRSMGKNIVFAEEQGGYVLTKSYVENAFFQDCIDEYRENIFWEDLVSRMAEKAVATHLGEEAFNEMSDEEIRRTSEPLEKALWQECSRHGLERLGFLIPPSEA